MRLLDLFSGAGGAAKGYQMAGFDDITGVDIRPMKRYPFRFIQGDALEYVAEHGHEYDVIHASPECQGYSVMKHLATRDYRMQIAETREALQASGRPYVIENVEGARNDMLNPLMLCGTMFGMNIIRHRLFEIYPEIYLLTPPCCHNKPLVKQGRKPVRGVQFITVTGNFSDVEYGKEAMGIEWMVRSELTQAIPPVFTEYIGRHLLEAMKVTV